MHNYYLVRARILSKDYFCYFYYCGLLLFLRLPLIDHSEPIDSVVFVIFFLITFACVQYTRQIFFYLFLLYLVLNSNLEEHTD